jgi:hypothetical protein
MGKESKAEEKEKEKEKDNGKETRSRSSDGASTSLQSMQVCGIHLLHVIN